VTREPIASTIERLRRHAGLDRSLVATGTEGTVCGMLRPFRRLDQDALRDATLAALDLVGWRLSERQRIEAASAMVGLSTCVRHDALDPESMAIGYCQRRTPPFC
jgi:hypothetical protein